MVRLDVNFVREPGHRDVNAGEVGRTARTSSKAEATRPPSDYPHGPAASRRSGRDNVTVGERFILRRNRDVEADEWTEPDHRDSPFLLYVNETQRADELRELLEGVPEVKFLRTEEA